MAKKKAVAAPTPVGEGQTSFTPADEAGVWLPLKDIVVKPDEVQARVHILLEYRIDSMVAVLELGQNLNPITVYQVDKIYWLADGFHRVEAHKRLGREQINVEIRQGEALDLLLGAGSGNLGHGLPLSNPDKIKLHRMLWERNPTMARMKTNGYPIPAILLGDMLNQKTWRELSGRTKAQILGVRPSTENDWAQQLKDAQRPETVITSRGTEVKTTQLSPREREAVARLRYKVIQAVKNGKLTEAEAKNYKIEEFTTVQTDLWLWLHHPTKGKIKIDGRYERPADIVQKHNHAVEAAEALVNAGDREGAQPPAPAPSPVALDPNWRPAGNFRTDNLNEESPFNLLTIQTYNNAHNKMGRMEKAIKRLEDALMEFEEALTEAKQIHSVRSINDMGGNWKSGTVGLLARVKESMGRMDVFALIRLMEQLDGGEWVNGKWVMKEVQSDTDRDLSSEAALVGG